MVVPSQAALRSQLLHEMHDIKIGGHSGVLRTFKKLAQQFYWPKMYQAVQEYLKKCDTCQRVKSETLSPSGLLQPLPIPCQVWDDITLDFIEGLPVVLNSINLEGQGRQPPASQPPAVTDQPPATSRSRQPPSLHWPPAAFTLEG